MLLQGALSSAVAAAESFGVSLWQVQELYL